MKTRTYNIWYSLSSSYWFVPAILAGVGIGLAYGMFAIDLYLWKGRSGIGWWVYSGDIEGARTVLSSIATAMMTIASIVFSISLLVISTTVSQYGPLLIRNFMHDKVSQVVFGLFVAIFIYCYLTLNIMKGHEVDYTPSIAVTAGVVLGIVSVGFLIYFIHHMAASIHSNNVVARVGQDLKSAIERLYPERDGEIKEKCGESRNIPPDFDEKAVPVLALKSGYIKAIDSERLLKMAVAKDLLLRLNARAGEFVNERQVLARVWPAESVDDQIAEEIERAFIRGNERTLEQDVEFGVDQIVEVALRALSPSLNDPLIALNCMDWLGAGLLKMTNRQPPSAYRFDGEDRLRIIAKCLDFPELVDRMFLMLRQYTTQHVAVTIRLLEVIRDTARSLQKERDRVVLLRHALLIERASQDAEMNEFEKEELEGTYRAALRALHHETYPETGKLSEDD